jgi:hypothetical protein
LGDAGKVEISRTVNYPFHDSSQRRRKVMTCSLQLGPDDGKRVGGNSGGILDIVSH